MRDNNDFPITLKYKDGFDPSDVACRLGGVGKDVKNEKSHKVSPKKTTKRPFKKGSWKNWLYKFTKKYYNSKHTVNFHYDKASNICVIKTDNPKVSFFNIQLPAKKLKKLSKASNSCKILIDAGTGVYLSISLECYKKLSKLERIGVDFVMQVIDDGEDEPYDVYHNTVVIDTINSLMRFINYHRALIDGVAEIQARICCYSYFEFSVKTVAIFQNGETKAYKGDFNEFLDDFSFQPLL